MSPPQEHQQTQTQKCIIPAYIKPHLHCSFDLSVGCECYGTSSRNMTTLKTPPPSKCAISCLVRPQFLSLPKHGSSSFNLRTLRNPVSIPTEVINSLHSSSPTFWYIPFLLLLLINLTSVDSFEYPSQIIGMSRTWQQLPENPQQKLVLHKHELYKQIHLLF